MVNVLEGCNGLKLAIVYAAYLLAVNGFTNKLVPQLILGMITIQLVNVIRIGVLVALRDMGGDTYFFFIKHVFGISIYLSIIVLWLMNPVIEKLMNRWMS
jgi:exosortase/archaeosortase family protein